MASGASRFPPGLQGGLEHDDEDHRLGETGQKGPEGDNDVDRSHREQGGRPDRPRQDRDPPRTPRR
ncbi:MAG: hypothetical protein J7598_00075 [Mitsuaria chitosanitabida]|uniref:hypothetical protein n=1 Tax=Roseateles chitosanitabidus TaxID=65048 RepID=UPI00082EC28A|nr:hypothetical protein [Roseateles chitosanitabidus]MBO9684981.1 hypothetical protein [Roseateles chitosanitabidus]